MKMQKKACLLFLMIFFGLFNSSCVFVELLIDAYRPTESMHVLEQNEEFELVWENVGIAVSHIAGGTDWVVIHGLKNDRPISPQLFALNRNTGQQIWNLMFSNSVELLGDNDIFYSGNAGSGIVNAYDALTGKEIWHTRLVGSHSVENLARFDDELYVQTSDFDCYFLDMDGKKLDHWKDSFHTYHIEGDIWYMQYVSGIRAVNHLTQETIWETEIASFRSQPVFYDGSIYSYSLQSERKLFSIDQQTGAVNWKVQENILSNLYLEDGVIYFINKESELVKMDSHSGQVLSRYQFSPEIQIESSYDSCFVIGDPGSDMLVISFADNDQLIGLRKTSP